MKNKKNEDAPDRNIFALLYKIFKSKTLHGWLWNLIFYASERSCHYRLDRVHSVLRFLEYE